MHIGIDARMYGPAHRGLGRYIQRLIEGLAQRDDNNRYTLFMTSQGLENFTPPSGKFKVVRADVPWYTLREQILMPWLVKKSNVEIMHWPHINVPYFCPVPFAVTVHDLIVWRFPDSRATSLPAWKYRLKLWAYKKVMCRAIKQARRVITISQFTKRDIMRQFKTPEKKIIVAYLGTDKMLFGTEKIPNSESFNEYLSSRFNIKKSYLLYVGSAYPHKNLERLIRAYALTRSRYNRNWQLVLVGRHDWFYNQLKEFIAKAVPEEEIRKDILLPGQVSDKDLDGLYRGARIFVFPSLYEGFGLPPLEAASRGVVVAAAKSASLPEILADAAYYFDPENIENMAQAIDVLGSTRHLQDELVERGFARVKQFSWDKMTKETAAAYSLVG
ncbi:MAG: glycosyltransferase family 1 protein [Candidatus Komeilibacteria bacterium]|nr:glycosyltransferase family 1 protein [Candidatus Komeilibacteria bacterium]